MRCHLRKGGHFFVLLMNIFAKKSLISLNTKDIVDMVIYGWKTKDIKKSVTFGEGCKECGSQKTHIVGYSKYFHLFWIPMFPYKKTLEILCDNCNYLGTPDGFKGRSHDIYKSKKSKVKSPFYMYSGTILILAAITYFYIHSDDLKNQYAEYIQDPQKDDILLIHIPNDTSSYSYSFLKITRIAGDSVWASRNAYSYNGYLFELDSMDGFYERIEGLYLKTRLVQMFEDEEIVKVQRGLGSPRQGFHQTLRGSFKNGELTPVDR